MFKVYKPKGDRVKAVQVTPESAAEIAETFMGRVAGRRESGIEGKPTHVDIPTLDGIKNLVFGTWIVKTDKNGLKFLSDTEFNETYEPARVVAMRDNA